MEFKQYFEALDVHNAPTDNVNLESDGVGYYNLFIIDGRTYKVSFYPVDHYVDAKGKIVNYSRLNSNKLRFTAWSIGFKGPDRYSLTGLGKNMFLIYKNLLLSVKKLMEIENVEALTFTAADPAMEPMYISFYKKYLGQEFVWYSDDLLINRDLFKRIYKIIEDGKKWTNQLKLSQQEKLNSAAEAKKNKIFMRGPMLDRRPNPFGY